MTETREQNTSGDSRGGRTTATPTALASGGVGGVGIVGVGVLAAAAVIAGGTQAYGEVVRFDNPAHGDPGHFEWVHATVGEHMWLDLTAGPGDQVGWLSQLGKVGQRISASYGSYVVSARALSALQVGIGYPYNLQALGVDGGELIPTPGAGWEATGIWAVYPNWSPQSLIPEGTRTYLGVRFDFGGGDQYAWIGVVRTGLELEAFAWGYETVPGVPIAAGAPAPGTLALLAFGAATGLTRKRRKDN